MPCKELVVYILGPGGTVQIFEQGRDVLSACVLGHPAEM